MHNVKNWCNNSIDFSIEHPELVENPTNGGEIDQVADFNYIHRIEEEFDQKVKDGEAKKQE